MSKLKYKQKKPSILVGLEFYAVAIPEDEAWLLFQKFMIRMILSDNPPSRLTEMQELAKTQVDATGPKADLRDWILAGCPDDIFTSTDPAL